MPLKKLSHEANQAARKIAALFESSDKPVTLSDCMKVTSLVQDAIDASRPATSVKLKEEKQATWPVLKTSRGFQVVEFRDANGEKCSLQQSSAILTGPLSVDRPGSSAIWLGCDNADPKIMASKAAQHGVETSETTGWVPYPVPDDVLMNTRMHLDRERVVILILHLQAWLDTGKLKA